ncbi:Splicing factor-like protein [Trema orientale]|uniref:Splicing factor-like protein n=1 Tax=Trema orientale TaxID=63057 RepID=A0A2P5EE62_TREOI|nr:Splicing factor-like protein [Trema orientale]
MPTCSTPGDRNAFQPKLFIRGLGRDNTTEGLYTLFSAYGELEEAVVILDKATAKSKGYSFVTFRHVDGTLLILTKPNKRVDGRMTVPQLVPASQARAYYNLCSTILILLLSYCTRSSSRPRRNQCFNSLLSYSASWSMFSPNRGSSTRLGH